MNYLFNPYMSKEPTFRLFKPPLECQHPIYRLCVKRTTFEMQRFSTT